MNTRATAAAILLRIREHGAYSNVLLPRATRELSDRNRSFVYRLVIDSLRQQRTVDDLIEATTSRPLSELDPEVAAVLQIAVAELLSEEPDAVYATVNESVEAVRQLGLGRAAGMVNGVLRRMTRAGLPELPADRARTYSVPEWVLGQITQDHGRVFAGELLAGLRAPAPGVGIRVARSSAAPEGAVAIDGIEGAFRVGRAPEPSPDVVVMDGASVAVAQAVAAQPKEHILDMAAAPGGKTIAMWDDAGGIASVVAMDSHLRRLLSARRRLDDHAVNPAWIVADGTRAPFADESFDAVLLDAPCTGLGTLRRRPEIAMRLKAKAAASLAETQRAMLGEAWRLIRAGGRIIYSVCTVFAAETIDVVAPYPRSAPSELPGLEWGGGLLLAPHLTDTDGMFISVIRKGH
ncbi:MAG: transcription antitermination factor NusB [Acidimicrobiia bacterium]|nr:transcription antitermination factor NusB [Acidimicrobiia bacterium]